MEMKNELTALTPFRPKLSKLSKLSTTCIKYLSYYPREAFLSHWRETSYFLAEKFPFICLFRTIFDPSFCTPDNFPQRGSDAFGNFVEDLYANIRRSACF